MMNCARAVLFRGIDKLTATGAVAGDACTGLGPGPHCGRGMKLENKTRPEGVTGRLGGETRSALFT